MGKKGFTEEEWKIVENTIYQRMLEIEKNRVLPEDSIIPQFEDELRNLGFQFELGNQAEVLCQENMQLTKPIILKYYEKTNIIDDKTYLITCLISSKNKDLIPFFIEEFYGTRGHKSMITDMIGNCLMITADKKYLNEYLDMLNDKKLNDEKAYIVITVGKLKAKEAIPFLISLLDKKNMCGFVLDALNKYKDPSLLPIFKKYENDKNSRYRNAAKKGIKTIEKILSN